jgi:hypothetical protein
MEDTEYLPTCGSIPIGLRRKAMKGKFLTRNIVLFTECANEKCDQTGKISVEDLRDHGEGECGLCGDIMYLSQECMIKN